MSCISGPCLTSDELKYTMIRLAVDGADVYAVEHGCATNIKVVVYVLLHIFIFVYG